MRTKRVSIFGVTLILILTLPSWVQAQCASARFFGGVGGGASFSHSNQFSYNQEAFVPTNAALLGAGGCGGASFGFGAYAAPLPVFINPGFNFGFGFNRAFFGAGFNRFGVGHHGFHPAGGGRAVFRARARF